MKAQTLLLLVVILPCVLGFSFFGKTADNKQASPSLEKLWGLPAADINADPDHCFPYTTCQTCIAQKYCGWCSTPVIGGNGAQCAGFSPTNGSSPFICIGTYQTTTCIPPITSTASSASASTGSGSSGTTSSGSTGTTSTGTTGVEPKPVVQGTWRGLQVNTGYVAGEWDFMFTNDNVTIKGPANFVLAGLILSSATEMDVVVTQSSIPSLVGKTLYGIYEQDFGPATLFLSWALAPATAKVPPTWGSAMKDASALVWEMEQPKEFLWN